MTSQATQTQIEYGDFQTLFDLAKRVCQKLIELGVVPETIIEPTCGIGAFVEAAALSFPNAKIIGVEINPAYLDALEERRAQFESNGRVELRQGNFFELDLNMVETTGKLLALRNFPWVTNSQQGVIGGVNLPRKKNFGQNGLDAITGKSNFDISEWMLMQTARWFTQRPGYLAMLCKTSVARKFLNHLYLENIGIARAALYGIDTKREFDVSVDACLLFCEFDTRARNFDYDVFEHLDSTGSYRVGHLLHFLMSPSAQAFSSALILWDEKRPIKSSILNNLNLQQFESTQAIRLF